MKKFSYRIFKLLSELKLNPINWNRKHNLKQEVADDPIEHEPMKPEEDGLFPATYLATIEPSRLSKEAQIKVFNFYFKDYASPLCKKCYGRGYANFNHTTKKLEVCTCVEKKIADQLSTLIPEEDQKVNLILPKGIE